MRALPELPESPELPEPSTPEGRAGLAALLARPEQALLAFDFDGTLSPIVEDPASARAHPGAIEALAELTARVGRVAVITGRPAAVVVELADLRSDPRLAGLVVLGAYGRERWDGRTGRVESPPTDPGVGLARAALPDLLAALSVPAHIEDKGAAVAVHTRRLPDPPAAFEVLRAPLTELASRHGLVVEPGRHVLELRPPGFDKGAALLGLAEAGPPSAVVFVGDDLGDLPAFDAVAALHARGVPGLRICSGSTEAPALAGRTDLVVDGPAGVQTWIEAFLRAVPVRP